MWTDCIPRTEHNSIFLNCDYGPTTLGPIPTWGPALRLYATMVFADSRGAGVYWGPDRIAFYNEKFAVCCGGAHPFLMGKGFKDAFSTLWDGMSQVFIQAADTGQTVDVDNILLFPIRNGYVEETYFIGQFIPLRGDSGEVEGFYNTVVESTRQVLQQRRRAVVDRIATIPPNDLDETLALTMEALRGNPHDITMALLYSYDESIADGTPNLQLRGRIAVPEDHKCAPSTACLSTDHVGLVQFFRKTIVSGQPHLLSESDGSLQAADGIFDGIPWCGYGEQSRDIVVLPLMSGATTLGFYVQGINPRRAYDDDYEKSILDTARQIERKWLLSVSRQQAKAREQALQSRATDSENRLRHMARYAPLGMCQITPDHKIQWANDQYYEISGHDRSNPDFSAFRELIAPEERSASLESLREVLNGKPRHVREVRMRREWTPPVKDDEGTEKTYAWVLTSSFPFVENGKVKLIMGYIWDISYQKWAEGVQTRLASMAILAKRRQEEFIDTTSHEMRNPLTAITQLADGIAGSLPDDHVQDLDVYRNILNQNVESAKTILACAAHQKRIIDDVLILSRLESQMLSITPVVERIGKVVADTIKMFDGEVSMHGTKIQATPDPSDSSLPVDYIWVDTSRLVQVLINFISNAIKFSSTASRKEITVMYGVRACRPSRLNTIYGDLEWKGPLDPERHNGALPPLDKGEERQYLYISVQDTGTGMSAEEMARLFKRFSQATSRTHIAYGGSGLGLYICRELAEKQGGSVGVASQLGKGSVFGFYIETRAILRAEALPKRPHFSALGSVSQTWRDQDPDSQQNMSSAVKGTDLTPDQQATSPGPEKAPLSTKSLAAMRISLNRRKYRVLLVEDNLVNQKVLAKQLRMANCTVTVANHGKEALQSLEHAGHWQERTDKLAESGMSQTTTTTDGATELFEVVLMDWEMPIMNGLECCKEIRRREQTYDPPIPRLPVIATTANVRQEQKDQAFAAGMDEVLAKPFTVSDLLWRIDEVLATKDADRFSRW